MKEVMKALKLKDNSEVTVERISGIKWKDTISGEEYFLHIDIELLY